LKVPLVAIIATHGHSDHVTAAFEVQTALGVPFYMHAHDIFFLDRMKVPRSDPPPTVTKTLSDGDILPLGLVVMHTPGHTPGSVTLAGDGVAFVGDLIFADGAVGRTDFSYSRPLDLAASVRKILSLPSQTILYCGHGEPTTVAKERVSHSIDTMEHIE
ncbi:hypothetical protein A2875_01255, partial [Candidatus Gottesmanbacteria bacterium RIFCSPHIGHO2_01_FULL_46_14]